MSELWLRHLAPTGNAIEDLEARAYTIAVPAGHMAVIIPISSSSDDDGARTIDHAVALHRVTNNLDSGELSPIGYDGFGAPLYSHQIEPEDG